MTTVSTAHAHLLQSQQYLAHDESPKYGTWDKIAGREHAHILTKDGEPAVLVIVGQISADRISVGPLGNYQTQEEKGFDSSFRVECKDAKLVFNLRRPAAYPEWTKDYDTAICHIRMIQNAIAQGSAPRLWFLDEYQEVSTLRFVRPLWEKKDFFPEDEESDPDASLHPANDDIANEPDEADADFERRKKNAFESAKTTANYTVPLRFKDAFETVALDHDIDIPPVFLASGKLVPPSQLAVRLPNALVEVMFSLRHYHITESKKPTQNQNSRFPPTSSTSNTFTATAEQIKILASNIDPKRSYTKKMTTVASPSKPPASTGSSQTASTSSSPPTHTASSVPAKRKEPTSASTCEGPRKKPAATGKSKPTTPSLPATSTPPDDV